MRAGQSGAGFTGSYLFDPAISGTARRFRHVRFAWDCHHWDPSPSPKAEAEHYLNECRLRELAAEIIAEGMARC